MGVLWFVVIPTSVRLVYHTVMAKSKPKKESPSPSASTRKAASTQYDTQFNPIDTTKNIVAGTAQALFNAATGKNGGILGLGINAVKSFAGTASRVDDYAVRALNATGIKKATPVALQTAKRNTYGYETADLLNFLAVKGGVSKTSGAVVKSGVPARLTNKLKNQSVVVHGTGRPIVGNQIRPTAGSPGSPNEAVVFSWNPKYSPPDQKWIAPAAGEYAGRPYYKGGVEVPGEGNVVVGTVKNKTLKQGEYVGSPMAVSTGSVKIKKVVKYDADTQTYVKNLERALQRQGVRVKPNLSEIRASKKQAAELAKRKRNAPPSPV